MKIAGVTMKTIYTDGEQYGNILLFGKKAKEWRLMMTCDIGQSVTLIGEWDTSTVAVGGGIPKVAEVEVTVFDLFTDDFVEFKRRVREMLFKIERENLVAGKYRQFLRAAVEYVSEK